MSAEFDTTLEPEPVCPHCGYKHGDAWEWNLRNDSGEVECDVCGKSFTVDRVIDISYTTRALDTKQGASDA